MAKVTLTKQQKNTIRKKYNAGATQTSLSKEYCISSTTVKKIIGKDYISENQQNKRQDEGLFFNKSGVEIWNKHKKGDKVKVTMLTFPGDGIGSSRGEVIFESVVDWKTNRLIGITKHGRQMSVSLNDIIDKTIVIEQLS